MIPDTIISLKEKIIIRNPNYNRPWQHVLEPLKGYLILALKQYVNPQKYASAWNFGTNQNTLTSVKKIVEYIIRFWGSGSMKVKNKLYEQVNLQLNIKRLRKF